MLTIVCGEDIQKARASFLALIESYKKKGFAIQSVSLTELPDVYKNATGVVDLFGQESVYIVDRLSSKYAGRAKTDFKDVVQAVSKHTTFHLLDWEEGKSAYDLTSLKKLASTFIEEKPDKNIFQLLDSCYPGNLKQFVALLEEVDRTQDSMFMYTLIWRHIRKLILARENALDASTPPWQRGKLAQQANHWEGKKLSSFYEGLIRIDLGMKSSTSTFDIKDSLEILACHYLK